MDKKAKAFLDANQQTRRAALRDLAAQYSGSAALAAAVGVSAPYLSQLIGKNPSRPITDTTARDFEAKLSLAFGSLDA